MLNGRESTAITTYQHSPKIRKSENPKIRKKQMDFKKQKPIYLQIADTLCERIVNEEWGAEQRIASVRDVAVQLGVNPNTVMRTFEYLQQAEIIFNKRGLGYYVSPDAKEKIQALHRKEFVEEELPSFIQKMKMLGLTIDDIQKYM